MSDIQKNLESNSEFQKKSELELKNEHDIKSKEIDVNAGFLGKFFGSNENAPVNISGLIIMSLILSGILVTVLNTDTYAKDFWIIVSPLITLSLGYLFGHKNT